MSNVGGDGGLEKRSARQAGLGFADLDVDVSDVVLDEDIMAAHDDLVTLLTSERAGTNPHEDDGGRGILPIHADAKGGHARILNILLL